MKIDPDPKPQDPSPEEEYSKPNPEVSPRNISLAEIAKTVAEQHKVEFAETLPTISEDGEITQPPEAAAAEAEEPPPPLASEEAVVPGAPSGEPTTLAPAAPEAVDPEKMYKVKVDGQELEVKGSAIIDAGYRTFQKETAADFRLKMASELLREAEAKARESTPQGTPQKQEPSEKPEGRTDAELAHDLQFGSPEQATAAMAELRTRDVVRPDQIQQFAAQQARMAAQDELQFQSALSFVQTEYKDLFSNDYLKRLFFVEENRRRAPKERGGENDRRPYKELYQAIGDDLRKAFNLPKASAPGAPTPQGTVAARAARKAETPPVPRTAAARLQEGAASEKAKTPSEIIASMAALRGKAQLSPPRKGT